MSRNFGIETYKEVLLFTGKLLMVIMIKIMYLQYTVRWLSVCLVIRRNLTKKLLSDPWLKAASVCKNYNKLTFD